MKFLHFYSKLQQNSKDLGEGQYSLLDIIDKYQFGSKNLGLAEYLDRDIKKYVNFIGYYCVNSGHVCFDIKLNEDENTEITYDGEKMTLKNAIAMFIRGQISDGWAEDGIYVLKNGYIGDPVELCHLSYEIYEKDYETYIKLHPDDRGFLGNCDLFKEIEIIEN